MTYNSLFVCFVHGTDRKWIDLENKMAANYSDKREPSAAIPEHHPNIYMALDLSNFSLHTTINSNLRVNRHFLPGIGNVVYIKKVK